MLDVLAETVVFEPRVCFPNHALLLGLDLLRTTMNDFWQLNQSVNARKITSPLGRC